MGSHCVHNYITIKMLLKLYKIVKDMNTFSVPMWYHSDFRIDLLYCNTEDAGGDRKVLAVFWYSLCGV
jgi:hypothetical protein